MHWDVAIIGAGLSGLAAGVRLAHFGQRVCIFERHTVWGGLNSFYKKDGHHFDTGLHAVTNWVHPGYRGPRIPLQRVCRQLRIRPEELGLDRQTYSQVVFDDATLRFENGLERLSDEIRDRFPDEIDGFERLAAACEAYPDGVIAKPFRSTRRMLSEYIRSPLLADMLLCPLLFYGSAEQDDVDWDQFIILFNSVYREGFCRPAGGVKPLLKLLVDRFTAAGGELRRRCGVEQLLVDGGRVRGLRLDDGSEVTADRVLSSAGLVETTRMRSDAPEASESKLGELGFTETIFVLDRPPAALGWDACITFYNRGERFRFRRPEGLVDINSGVICCPSNFAHATPLTSHRIRVTHLASWRRWFELQDEAYVTAKAAEVERSRLQTEAILGRAFGEHVTYTDAFTPKTVKRFTGHARGLIYGSPHKARDGRTDLSNLFVCGTAQGMLGIVGAMLSGVVVANAYGMGGSDVSAA